MTYQDTLDFLYNQFPMFHREGSAAYKPGLNTVCRLSTAFDNPHKSLRTIHVGGTNGKGSTAHSLAAVLQTAGYKTGLFTSPHIIDFRERIRIDGEMISKSEVIEFIESYRRMNLDISPSFFELTTIMAFDAFVRHNVDIAVIEVGLGGRLDSTNIINPMLSVITNISYDHTSLLGNTLVEIAGEKAGIIKHGIPVVIGESEREVRQVFSDAAQKSNSQIIFADDSDEVTEWYHTRESIKYITRSFGEISSDLTGDYQPANMRTILEAIKILRRTSGLSLPDAAVTHGLSKVGELTHLAGRWMKIADMPLTICDTGHNPGGWTHLSRQIDSFPGKKHIVIGFVNDKDVTAVMNMLKSVKNASFYFTRPSTPRALPAENLRDIANRAGLSGDVYTDVSSAYKKALTDIIDKSSEMIYVGGSTFVLSDLLSGNSLDFNKHLLG